MGDIMLDKYIDSFKNLSGNDKKEVIIDNYHADGCGEPANTANWMIEYQEHFTFINQGDTDRKITKVGDDYKITCTRIASTGKDLFPSYFIIGPDANGKLKIKEEMTTTYQQSILKHGK